MSSGPERTPSTLSRPTPEAVNRRPLVAIVGRFSAGASALRYAAVVVARKLASAVQASGGEPLMVVPSDAARVSRCLRWAQAVVLPGGADLSPATYGEHPKSKELYGIDHEQDAFDLAVASWALREGVPLLAICRGAQVVNVALGGSLHQHIEPPHLEQVHSVVVQPGTLLAGLVDPGPLSVSCHHHQGLAALGSGLCASSRAADGTVEAIELQERPDFFLGVQWHPEDTYESDPRQRSLFGALVDAASPTRPRPIN